MKKIYDREYFSNYEALNKQKRSDYRVKYYHVKNRELKNAVYEVLGKKCVKCGFQDQRALQIDHVNGDGAQDRKKLSGGRNSVGASTLYKAVLESVSRDENKYQILCANCNWIKKHENNENRKSRYEEIIKKESIEDSFQLKLKLGGN